MKVLHISPTYFDEDSVLGGGERYVYELCKEMANQGIEVSFLSFGNEKKRYTKDGVRYYIDKPLKNFKGNNLNPIVFPNIKLILEADIIHCHQYFNVLTEAYLFMANFIGKPVFVTDHGGGGAVVFHRLGLDYLVRQFLCVSNYSLGSLKVPVGQGSTIYGGADIKHFREQNTERRKNKYISTGRILPHKGHHHIIRCLKDEEELVIVGRNNGDQYYEYLKELAKGKNVLFKQNLTDKELLDEICSSSLAIFPSTNINYDGELIAGEPELFGLAPVEIMATGTPVIVSNIGSYPEISYSSDHVFKHGNTSSLRSKIDEVINLNIDSHDYRNHIVENFTWSHVARRCLESYKRYR